MKRRGAAVLMIALLAACNRSSAPDGGPTAQRNGDQSKGPGAVMGSCVETYSPEALASKEFAFDGELVKIDIPQEGTGSDQVKAEGDSGFGTVTLEVKQWFKGGEGSRIELRSSVPLDAVSSVDSPSLKEGDRYLVAGDDDYMHSCGFTREWSADEASEWEAAFTKD